MTGMNVKSIKKTKATIEWTKVELEDMFSFLNLKDDDLVEISLSIDKVEGNPIEWLQKKYLNDKGVLED